MIEEIEIEKERGRLEKLLTYLKENQHPLLKKAMNQLAADLKIAETPADLKNKEVFEFTRLFHETHEEVNEMISMEDRVIFPHIQSLLANPDEKAILRDYQNLSSPVRTLIIKHHTVLDKIMQLLQMVAVLGYEGYSDNNYRQAYTDLFDFYSFYEKQIYLEENILFPSLATVLEIKRD
jgi:iron-sulfur cluster repair protein YtfE (RIC family)